MVAAWLTLGCNTENIWVILIILRLSSLFGVVQYKMYLFLYL